MKLWVQPTPSITTVVLMAATILLTHWKSQVPVLQTVMQSLGLPNSAVQLAGNDNPSPVVVPALNLNGTNITIVCWINPDTMPQPDRAGILTCPNGGSSAGIRFNGTAPAGTSLSAVWNNAAFNTTLLPVPPNQWSFVAFSVTSDKATLFLGTNNAALQSQSFDGPFVAQTFGGTSLIGSDRAVASRYFQGAIDEVAIFNYSLSSSQITDLYKGIKGTLAKPTLSVAKTGSNIVISWPAEQTGFVLKNISGAWRQRLLEQCFRHLVANERDEHGHYSDWKQVRIIDSQIEKIEKT